MESFSLNPYFLLAATGGMFTLLIVVVVGGLHHFHDKVSSETVSALWQWTMWSGLIALFALLYPLGVEDEGLRHQFAVSAIIAFLACIIRYGMLFMVLVDELLAAVGRNKKPKSAAERARERLRDQKKRRR